MMGVRERHDALTKTKQPCAEEALNEVVAFDPVF